MGHGEGLEAKYSGLVRVVTALEGVNKVVIFNNVLYVSELM